MTITLDQFKDAMRAAHGGQLPLDQDQEQALSHNFSVPLWLIAGPGTGKTHTLSWLALKRLVVDGVDPTRLLLTTFTRRAARELEVRVLADRQSLLNVGVAEAGNFELADLMLGTLHSVASRVLQDARYPAVFRIPVLEDQLVQEFFLRRTRNPLLQHDVATFWQRMQVIPPHRPFTTRAMRASAATVFFNRMTENRVDIAAMRAAGDADLDALADGYEHYVAQLASEPRVDQASLQEHLLDYLATTEGQAWRGNGFTVIVDEYQDTNPIQEQVYFELAGQSGDLTVVGDDDQSLYRFRGASVESLVDFDQACQHYLGKTPAPVYLRENRRSHDTIVDWVNTYIGGHPVMQSTGGVRVRAPGKPPLVHASPISGNYPSLAAVARATHVATAPVLVGLIDDLRTRGAVTDLSQIALLSFSTRESTQGIGTYCDAVRASGFVVHNPRSRRAHLDAVVQQLVGGLSVVLDENLDLTRLYALPRGVEQFLRDARAAFDAVRALPQHAVLNAWVVASQAAIRNAAYDPNSNWNYLERTGGLRVTISALLFKLMGHEPFATALGDAIGGERIKALNLVVADYETLYSGGNLRLEDTGTHRVIEKWALYNLYSVFVEGIHDGLNDPEDDDVVDLMPGAINVLTIHQAKGLQFEVVVVLRPDKVPWVSTTHQLEDELDPYSHRPAGVPIRRTQEERAAEDGARLYFVAHSRAKRLLVLAGVVSDKWNLALGQDPATGPIRNRNDLPALGFQLI
jgi:DNA helicase-2/ATP-dependent DNA helicase PcrA